MKRFGVIYKITCLVNGKIYFGKTVSTISKRFAHHASKSNDLGKTSIRLANAIRKYGKENFVIEEVYSACDVASLDAAEMLFIELFNTTDESIGYNIQKGGGRTNIGRKWSEETRKKQSESKKGKNAGTDHHMFGKKMDRKSVVKMSISRNTTNGFHGFSVNEEKSIYVRSGFFLKEIGLNPEYVLRRINEGIRYYKGYLWYRGDESLENVDKDIQAWIDKPIKPFSKEHMEKFSKSAHTPEAVEKMRNTILADYASGKRIAPWTGKKRDRETVDKIVAKKVKTIVLLNPAQELVTITNVKKFAQENGLIASGLRRVANGERLSHKGWTKPKSELRNSQGDQ